MPQETIKQEFGRLRHENFVIGWVLLAVTLTAVLTVGWVGDHRSCRRSAEIRQYIIDRTPIDKDAERYWRARGKTEIADRIHKRLAVGEQVHQLACGFPLPGV